MLNAEVIRTLGISGVCAVAIAAAGLAIKGPIHAQTRQEQAILAPRSLAELRQSDTRVQQMMRAGELRVRELRSDRMLSGRTIERADQYHQGVRVYGGGVTRQFAGGQTVSVFGTIYPEIALDTTIAVPEIEARRTIATRTGQPLGAPGELVVLPLEAGGYAVTWKIRAFTGDDLREFFVDAKTGVVVFDYSDLQTQSAVGRGTGVNGDSLNKKMSVTRGSGDFFAEDALRPASLRTYDLKGDPVRTLNIVNLVTAFAQSDFASDADNVWTDGAVVDAHVYTGYTYDYYFRRFGRRGINDANLTLRTIVHPVRRENFATQGSTFSLMFANAFYTGNGMMVYGVGLPDTTTANGRTWNFTSAAIDIVAHEITHGVTDYTSDLIYMNESGALNESFSDIMATSVEFFFQAAGDGLLRADYICGEDAVRGTSNPTNGIRSLANPVAYGHPDHYSIRFLGTADNGGVHINSSISNHAFYLAIEGGIHRLSGVIVQGVGSGNREQIERVFYRAFTEFLTPTSNFAVARAATIQAARDLYGAGSAPERAVSQAWAAVGVN